MKNLLKKTSLVVTSLLVSASVFAQSAPAGGAEMVKKVEDTITANSGFLWGVGAAVMSLVVIGLVIRKIRSQAS